MITEEFKEESFVKIWILILFSFLFYSPFAQAGLDQWETTQSVCKQIGQKKGVACTLKTSANAFESYMQINYEGKKFKLYESEKENRLNALPATVTKENNFTCLTQVKDTGQNICYRSEK